MLATKPTSLTAIDISVWIVVACAAMYFLWIFRIYNEFIMIFGQISCISIIGSLSFYFERVLLHLF